MTAKTHTLYVCAACGATSPKWQGKCDECGEWNSFSEEVVRKTTGVKIGHNRGVKPEMLSEVTSIGERRISTAIPELDRVLGGGLVPGSVVLLAGDPGIGKSTLMLQMLASVSVGAGAEIVYCSGEESSTQIKMRAERLGVSAAPVMFLAENNVDAISAYFADRTGVVIVVDSIQTAFTESLESFAGSVSQVRESAGVLLNLAKSTGNSIFIVGHITKEGSIAGPKMLEHTVDTVLYLEGEKRHSYRVLRAIKNRFGSTNEIGIFEMRDRGLIEVDNPSEFFLSGREDNVAGSAVVVCMEGTRPLLLEIQALVTKSAYGMPQRNATGVDSRRLAMLIAVLEKRAGLALGMQDIFVNVTGGLRLDETSADLGVAAAVASSFADYPLGRDTVLIGEVGLGGELRAVSLMNRRLKEAQDLGFRHAVIPKTARLHKPPGKEMRLTRASSLAEALKVMI